ncbi:MAG: hypothetical protein JXD19_11740 [Deltaproteobacteria bacterium]|nr:hypothetical protein [Deltaproteobacteria bacterium]
MEREIINLIEKEGPLTGSEIKQAIGGDDFVLWKTCKLSEHLLISRTGIRYLRLDRKVEGLARLSPSILREFLTYSVVGSAEDANSLHRKVQEVISRIEEVSRCKRELACRIVNDVGRRMEKEGLREEDACFILAGDVVYSMAHDVRRPERSTGTLVRGSDLDLVVVVGDDVPADVIKKLDGYIYQEKYRALKIPNVNEEIDYIVKRLDRVREQLQFDTFKYKVACKILQEGLFLYGSANTFRAIKIMLSESGIARSLEELEKQAAAFRARAEEYLLAARPDGEVEEDLHLFYPAEESEEFE